MRQQQRTQIANERRDGIPLYVTLQKRIQEIVQMQGLQPGDALPTEFELQTQFGVSRATIRQALAAMERRGLVDRQQGRGTFVTIPTMERSLPELTSFSEHVHGAGMVPSGRLVEYSTVISGTEGDSRHFPPGTQLVRVVRLRLANDVPIGLHTVYLPLETAVEAGFTEEHLRKDGAVSLYALLEAAGINLTWAEEHLQARAAVAQEATLLAAQRGAPVMSVLRLTRTATDVLVEVVRAVYLGDKYDYVVHLDRRSEGVSGGGSIVPGATQ